MLFISENDEEIIDLYKKGEKEAFKGLINRYTSPLYNFAARLTDRNNASDIVQETFIKVWKNLHNFDSSRASFKTWVFIIAKNTATDFLRKSGSASGGKKSINFSDIDNKTNEADISFSENISDENLLPDEVLQKLQDSDLLNKILDQLPINYKTVLTLHYQEDMTFDEIGKVLDKPLNTVKNQHYRAIISLRKMLN